MHSPPPDPSDDTAPHAQRSQVWVPGYYEPVSGAWAWHPGRVVDKRPGYRLVEARYIENGGEYHVEAPRWAPERIATRQ
jgi:hypothetical protein